MPDFDDEQRVSKEDDALRGYFLLDDGEARLGLSECCGRVVCTCGGADFMSPSEARSRARRYGLVGPAISRATDR